jgi:hypothetical protein
MTFSNGYTVVVLWGPTSHSDNKDKLTEEASRNVETAEILAWRGTEEFRGFLQEESRKYQTADQVADALYYIKSLPADV